MEKDSEKWLNLLDRSSSTAYISLNVSAALPNGFWLWLFLPMKQFSSLHSMRVCLSYSSYSRHSFHDSPYFSCQIFICFEFYSTMSSRVKTRASKSSNRCWAPRLNLVDFRLLREAANDFSEGPSCRLGFFSIPGVVGASFSSTIETVLKVLVCPCGILTVVWTWMIGSSAIWTRPSSARDCFALTERSDLTSSFFHSCSLDVTCRRELRLLRPSSSRLTSGIDLFA